MASKIKSNSERIPIRVGRFVVGYVRGDTFYKTVSRSKHFKRTPAGISNDVSTIDDALNTGASWVEVTDRETSKIYTATIDLTKEKGIYFNEGFGNQINLLFEHWTVTLDLNSKTVKRGEVRFAKGQGLQTRNRKGEYKPTPRQMFLYGGR